MGRSWGGLALALVGVCLAACSATVVVGVPLPAVSSPAAPSASSTTAKVTAACPFLPTAELQELLGTSEDLIATEQPPDRTFAEGTAFLCRYEGKYVHPWLLDLWIFAVTGSSWPVKALETYKADCSGPVTAVPGAGDGAYFCDRQGTEDTEMVITGEHSHDQNRLAIAYLVMHRSDVYAQLAAKLAARL